MASLSEFTFPGTVGGLQARPGSGWRWRETLGCSPSCANWREDYTRTPQVTGVEVGLNKRDGGS